MLGTCPHGGWLNQRTVELCAKCRGYWPLRKLAAVVLWKIKTLRGANERFRSAFVSSFNQLPQVTVSATTYAAAAALSLWNAQIHSVCVCCSVSQAMFEAMFLSAGRRA